MFPEGTRTTRAPLNPFRRGFTLIAKRAGVPIQTVFIDTDSPYLGKGWPLWRLPPLPIVFAVRLGRRFEPAPDLAALLREIERYFAASVRPRRATRAMTATASTHAPGPHPELQHRPQRLRDRARRARAVAAGVGGRRRQRRRHRRAACRRWRPSTPACACWLLPRNRGKGAAVLHGLRAGARRGLHACADDGRRRPAPGGADPRVHAALACSGPTR